MSETDEIAALEADIQALELAQEVLKRRGFHPSSGGLRHCIITLQGDLTLRRDPPPSALELLREVAEKQKAGVYVGSVWFEQVQRRLELDAPEASP